MTDEHALQLFYLTLLGLMVVSYFQFDAGRRFGETARLALVWLGIFMMVIVGYSFKDRLQSQLIGGAVQSVGEGEITLSRSFDGHFYARLSVNGAPVEFVVDTGASLVVLSRKDAETAGYTARDLRFTGRASTANGVIATAPVRLDKIVLGPFSDHFVQAAVNGGPLETSLLGMSYLKRFRSIEIRGNQMRLIR